MSNDYPLVGALLAGAGVVGELEAEAGLAVSDFVVAAGFAAGAPFFAGTGFCFGRKVMCTGPSLPLSPTM
jgi:hypothetical protein